MIQNENFIAIEDVAGGDDEHMHGHVSDVPVQNVFCHVEDSNQSIPISEASEERFYTSAE
jgi:hypothetical protein